MKKIIVTFIILFGLSNEIGSVLPEVTSTGVILKEQLENHNVNKKVISTSDAPKYILPLNEAVQINYILYLSGQVGIDPATGRLVSDDVGNQTQQIFRNIQAILHAAGSNLSQIARCLVLLTNISDFQSMNKIYASFFPSVEDYPARTTFAVESLPSNARVEIQCTAYTQWSKRNRTLLNCYERLTFSSNFMLFGLVFHLVLRFTF